MKHSNFGLMTYCFRLSTPVERRIWLELQYGA